MRCSVCDGDLPVEIDQDGNTPCIVNGWQSLASAMAPVKCNCPPSGLVGEMPDEESDEDYSNPIESLFGPDEEEDSEEDPYGF